MPFTQQLEPMGARAGSRTIDFILGMASKHEEEVERTKKANATAKALKTVMSNNPELLKEAGLTQEKFDGLGTEDTIATFGALSEKLAMDRVKGNLAAVQEQNQQMQFNRGERQAEQQDIAGALRGLQQVNVPQVQPGAVGPMGTPAMLSTPASNPNQMGAILSRLTAQFPRAAATLREEVKQQMELRQQGGPRATPGSIQRIPGLDSHVFGVQSPSGAGSFLPVGSGGGGATTATTAPRVTSADRRSALEALYGKGGVGGLVDQARMARQENKLGTLRELEAQIQQWQTVLGQPVAAGGAKDIVATGASDDPLGIFQ